MRHSIVTLIVLAAATPTNAEPPAKIWAELGFDYGSAYINGIDNGAGSVGGVSGALGLRPRPMLLLYTEYEVAVQKYRAPPPVDGAPLEGLVPVGGRGIEQRVGVAARYTLDRMGNDDAREDPFFDLWVEAGAGVEHFNWDAGGVWTRPDIALGFGLTTALRVGRRIHGLTYAFRAQFAPKQSVSNRVECGGPCDAPSAGTGWDRSVVFQVAWTFSR